MKKRALFLSLVLLFAFAVCTGARAAEEKREEKIEEKLMEITVDIGGRSYDAVLYDNAAGRFMAEQLPYTVRLNKGPIDYCGITALPFEGRGFAGEEGHLKGELLYYDGRFVLFLNEVLPLGDSGPRIPFGRLAGAGDADTLAANGPASADVTLAPKKHGGAASAQDTDLKNSTAPASARQKGGAAVGVFDFEKKTVLLNSGHEMPIVGLGTYALDHETCVRSVMTLLKNGGRLIDTAYMYHNEAAVGEGVRRAMKAYGIPREDIFVITKLYPNQFAEAEAAIERALAVLDLGYIDMMLLHHPGANDVSAYRAMEGYVKAGKIRSLGLSNWYAEELNAFLPQISILPALVQNEIHPFYQEREVVPFIQKQGMVVQCWYPLGGRGYTADLLGHERLAAIAGAHGVSPAQVVLRWELQRGLVVIPGSGNPEHIRENLDLFGFTLTAEEMRQIDALDRGEKHDWY